MKKISVCLATYNEEKNIKECLESIRDLADEVVVVDGRSSDKTVEVISSLKWSKPEIKIIVRENPLMFHINKQKSFEAATGDWILYLDADERVDEKLRKEIKKVAAVDSFAGYWIPRKNMIFGKWIKNEFWYPDYQLRFFKKGQARLPCESVHEQPKLTGKSAKLKNHLVHYNYQTISQFINKLNRLYSENDARVYLAKNKKINWHDALRFPVREFLATFFARKAYQDGLHGLVLSLLQAFSALVTFAKIWESQGFKQQELPINEFNREMKKLAKETSHWLTEVLVEKAKTSTEKYILKFKRKLS
ncbi:glycosyltransferase family 2 protein [Patescibacteria group bacterium]